MVEQQAADVGGEVDQLPGQVRHGAVPDGRPGGVLHAHGGLTLPATEALQAAIGQQAQVLVDQVPAVLVGQGLADRVQVLDLLVYRGVVDAGQHAGADARSGLPADLGAALGERMPEVVIAFVDQLLGDVLPFQGHAGGIQCVLEGGGQIVELHGLAGLLVGEDQAVTLHVDRVLLLAGHRVLDSRGHVVRLPGHAEPGRGPVVVVFPALGDAPELGLRILHQDAVGLFPGLAFVLAAHDATARCGPDGRLHLVWAPAGGVGDALDLALHELVLGSLVQNLRAVIARQGYPHVHRAVVVVDLGRVNLLHQILVEVVGLHPTPVSVVNQPLGGLAAHLFREPAGADRQPGLPLVPGRQGVGGVRGRAGAGRENGQQAYELLGLFLVAVGQGQHGAGGLLVPEAADSALHRQLVERPAHLGQLLGAAAYPVRGAHIAARPLLAFVIDVTAGAFALLEAVVAAVLGGGLEGLARTPLLGGVVGRIIAQGRADGLAEGPLGAVGVPAPAQLREVFLQGGLVLIGGLFHGRRQLAFLVQGLDFPQQILAGGNLLVAVVVAVCQVLQFGVQEVAAVGVAGGRVVNEHAVVDVDRELRGVLVRHHGAAVRVGAPGCGGDVEVGEHARVELGLLRGVHAQGGELLLGVVVDLLGACLEGVVLGALFQGLLGPVAQVLDHLLVERLGFPVGAALRIRAQVFAQGFIEG